MTISYNWLCDYLPEAIDPEKLSKILTSIGLEVESLERYESIRGGLAGLVVGEVLECGQHPNADKLKVTKVNVGAGEPLQIVCGASNVAAGQKVIVATVGTTIYPVNGDPLTMRVAKIRGVESHGMICAEDEIGLGADHAGIIVMPENAVPGSAAADYFKPYADWIYEIGLTPNRMDAMSHYGVARDVCAYLTHHSKETKVKSPLTGPFSADNNSKPVKVTVQNKIDCERYAGVSIAGVTVGESPKWLKDRLVSIGLRSINNIVDITNFILHETGQPLHAFDADMIAGNEIIVKNLPEGTLFVSLDEKERKLSSEDLMICNGKEEGMCIAGVFGGLKSGVTAATKNIFLESAWFHPVSIRKTSVRHELRTDAATRFEKGVDISNTVNVLKRAALLIREIAGGEIASEVVDVYPDPKPKTEVTLKNHYLKKLSGKNYHSDAVKKILTSLGFDIVREGIDEIRVGVPYSKPDISIPADIVEEILRIDGLDNIEIPATITISPSVENLRVKEALRDKIAGYLVGQGFVEILTNSITNSRYFDEAVLETTVKMINNLSEELNVLRPSMVETGLEAISYNLNRRNNNLQFFEFGKTYTSKAVGAYQEDEHLCLYITGSNHEDGWREKSKPQDFYKLKGLTTAVCELCGLNNLRFESAGEQGTVLDVYHEKTWLGKLRAVDAGKLQQFDIRQPVYILDISFASLENAVSSNRITYREVNRFPVMQRDLAMVVNRSTTYESIEQTVKKVKLPKLKDMRLFDVFESEKLGAGKKSMAISFLFSDDEKTLTDKEVDGMIARLVQGFETDLAAEIRK
ncbi:phenylalanine--tRNA ligase subunit beta [Sediminibacterium roseum]|uniref:Phenylalanine--tRNA ligase beta subunit n=1 Tax=Sediminibacterium roseum TaxID=1978412 RepID=A0ABW9ZRB7_9BACT|nr:phenylalanine--tRNA ligase subunit beta [Sediminibacterium roseum]NCI48844.1 phenylalanine--tRNA ligase subunit beta [Sediminibacterium roseum]